MQTIFQETKLAFNSISLQDAIIMLPVMDNLAKSYLDTVKRATETQEKDNWQYREAVEQVVKYGNQLKVMKSLGFCVSDPASVQSSEWFSFEN